jgi:hypothetical protein
MSKACILSALVTGTIAKCSTNLLAIPTSNFQPTWPLHLRATIRDRKPEAVRRTGIVRRQRQRVIAGDRHLEWALRSPAPRNTGWRAGVQPMYTCKTNALAPHGALVAFGVTWTDRLLDPKAVIGTVTLRRLRGQHKAGVVIKHSRGTKDCGGSQRGSLV